MPYVPKRFFFLPPEDPAIMEYRALFEQSVNKETKVISIDVPPEIVDEGYVEMPHKIILALQHYPQHIEKVLFSLELLFEQFDGSGTYRSDWKSNAKYWRWFSKMGEFPLTVFFLNDPDARFYTLAGDLLADGRMPVVKTDEASGRVKLAASGEVAATMNSRLHDACIYMLYYCYGSGFGVKPYIETLMAEFNVLFTFEALRDRFEQEIKKGTNVTVMRRFK